MYTLIEAIFKKGKGYARLREMKKAGIKSLKALKAERGGENGEKSAVGSILAEIRIPT